MAIAVSAPFTIQVSDAAPGPAPAGWEELPGTSLSSAWATLCASYGLPTTITGVGGDMQRGFAAWNSGCVDTARNKFVAPRWGGHADWAGNQVLTFDLTTHQWEMPQPFVNNYPTAPIKIGGLQVGEQVSPVYLDGSPSSMHTYNSVEYIPTMDRVISLGGIWWSGAGESIPRVMEWNGTNVVATSTPATLAFFWNPGAAPGPSAWEAKTPVPYPSDLQGSARQVVWDPVLERVWYRRTSSWYLYDPATDTYVNPTGRSAVNVPIPGGNYLCATVCLDNVNRRLFTLWFQDITTVGIQMMDLNIPDANEVSLGVATADVSYGHPVVSYEGLGAFYDEDSDKIVLYGRNPTTGKGVLYQATPEVGFTWEMVAPATSPEPPAPAQQGVWKRFFKHGSYYYLIHPSWTQNVWRFNPSISSGVGSWNTFAAPALMINAGVTSLKQASWEYCTWDNRIYQAGGDLISTEDGGRMIFALDPVDHSWEMIQDRDDYAGVPFSELPPTGDCYTWVWNEATNRFCFAFGFNFSYSATTNPDVRYQAQFDPVTRTWGNKWTPYLMGGGEPSGHGDYDSGTQRVIKWANGSDPTMWHMDFDAQTVDRYNQSGQGPGTGLQTEPYGSTDFGTFGRRVEYRVDAASRRMWWHCPWNGKLHYWHLDNHQWIFVDQNPVTPSSLYTMPSYTSATQQYQLGYAALNQSGYTVGALCWTGTRLLIPIILSYSGARVFQLVAYTPSTATWDLLWEDLTPEYPTHQPQIPHGERTVWDPVNRRMYMFGRTFSTNFWYWQEP